MTTPTDFHCGDCQKWTPVAPAEWGGVRCVRCGSDFQCGECGYEIDCDGNCLREEGHPE